VSFVTKQASFFGARYVLARALIIDARANFWRARKLKLVL
jgi:hypothetical protein